MYEKTFFAGWGDMDFNSHMRNTAYLEEHGFPMSEFVSRRIGPVILLEVLRAMPRTEDFQVLASSLRL